MRQCSLSADFVTETASHIHDQCCSRPLSSSLRRISHAGPISIQHAAKQKVCEIKTNDWEMDSSRLQCTVFASCFLGELDLQSNPVRLSLKPVYVMQSIKSCSLFKSALRANNLSLRRSPRICRDPPRSECGAMWYKFF